MMHMRPPAPPPPPPSRIVRDDDFYGAQRENEANYRRYELKIQCLMLIDQDRRCGLNIRVIHER
jgi:hypothetical protein